MTKFVLDGKEFEVAPGTTILTAARAVEIEIPTFCYQDRLTTLASCRMCLIEIEGRRKLEPACATVVSDDMVVHTRSEKVVGAREDMLEILLANHPLDCPICDKGGECELQDSVFEYGKGDSRFYDDKRVFRTRDINLNDVIVFNANRCIQCQRCVRVCEEVVGDVALGTAEKGLDSEITGVGNSLKDCSHCGNCIEVCPVGALMSIPYRYKARPWDMVQTETTCAMCGTGCSLTAETRDGKLMRIKSNYETGLNGELLCAKGRFGFDFIDGGQRITEPLIRKNGVLTAVSWDESIEFIGTAVKNIRDTNGQIYGQISPRQTNETAYMFQKLMRDVFKTHAIYSSNRFEGFAFGGPDTLQALHNVIAHHSRKPLKEVLNADCVFVLGSNITDENPVSGYLTRTTLRDRKNALLIASSRPSGLDNIASATLRLLPGLEGSLMEALTKVEPATSDKTVEFVTHAQPLIASANTVALLIGTEFLRTKNAQNCLEWIDNYTRQLEADGKTVAVQFLFDRPNQLGLWDMGCLPEFPPDWRKSEDHTPLNTNPDMLYVLGADPIGGAASGSCYDAAMNTECLVVQDAYFSQTTERATVILPAPSYGEAIGSYTNNEGRVQKIRNVRPAAPNARPILDVINAIALVMGDRFGPHSPEDVITEITQSVQGYQKLDLKAENDMGFTFGRPNKSEHLVRETHQFNAPEAPKGSYFLITGDDKFSAGTISTHSKILPSLGGGPYAEMNFEVQNGREIDDYKVTVSRNGVSLTVPLKLNKSFAKDVVFIPESVLQLQASKLLSGPQYPGVVDVTVSPELSD
ncbi:NADH dehydrogenase (quinone) subunit G [Rhodobacterales bacterium 52_120_T64]|nr:NADH dehydrogenase (quinone) subunit G [Rhodobacterales bacterium 52_120_T64]